VAWCLTSELAEQTNIHQTQEIIELILDSSRNSLLSLDLKVSIGTMGLGGGALIASLFGMNLTTGLEHHPHAFSVATVSCGIVAIAISVYALKRLKSLRKVGLASGAFGSGKADPSRTRMMKKMRHRMGMDGHW
jgi:magnesium transporter